MGSLRAFLVGNFRGFRRGADSLDGIVARELATELGPRLLRVSRQAAPHQRGALERGLAFVPSRTSRLGVEVISTVRSAEGYPYTDVTRFGHRKAWIEPRRKKALRTPWGPRKRVRGYKPSHDWADDAYSLAQPHIARSADRVGRQLAAAVAT